MLDRQNRQACGVLADWSHLDLDILSSDSKSRLGSFFFPGQKQRCAGNDCTFQNLPAVRLFIHGVPVASFILEQFRSLL
jgi:hypothetical protein